MVVGCDGGQKTIGAITRTPELGKDHFHPRSFSDIDFPFICQRLSRSVQYMWYVLLLVIVSSSVITSGTASRDVTRIEQDQMSAALHYVWWKCSMVAIEN